MKFLTKACFGVLLAASAMSTPAFAQEEEAPSGPFSLSGGISVTSDYRFRGISLSNEKPAIQPTLTLSHKSGFYVGTWQSSLTDTPTYGKWEVDLYAGWTGDPAAFSGRPSRSSHKMRRQPRQPSRSSAAMIGRPVLEPRTAWPTRGVFMLYFS